MGKVDTERHQQPNGEHEKPTAANANGGSTSTKATRSTGTGGRGNGGRSATGATEKEKSPRVVLVGDTPSQEDDKPKSPGTSKRTQQRKAAAAKKEKEQQAANLKPHLTMVLVVSFDLMGKNLGDHWKVSQEEAEKVAEPLSHILGEYIKASEKMEKYADWMGVIGALAMIVVPRLLIHQSVTKQKKGVKTNYATMSKSTARVDTGGTGTNEGASPGTSRPVNHQPTANGQAGFESVLAPLGFI